MCSLLFTVTTVCINIVIVQKELYTYSAIIMQLIDQYSWIIKHVHQFCLTYAQDLHIAAVNSRRQR